MKKNIAAFMLFGLSAQAFAETNFSLLKEILVIPTASVFQSGLNHTAPIPPRIPLEEWEIDSPAQSGIGGKAAWKGFDTSNEFGRWSVEGTPRQDLQGIDWFQPNAWQDVSFDDNDGAPRFQTQGATNLQIRIEKTVVSKEDCLEWVKNKTNKVRLDAKLTLGEAFIKNPYFASMTVEYMTPQVNKMTVTNPDGTTSVFEEKSGRMIVNTVADLRLSANSNQLLLETESIDIPEIVCETNNGVTVSLYLNGLQTATITSLRFGVKAPF